MHTAEIDLAVAHLGDNFVSNYVGEIETKFENTLFCLSVAPMCSNHEKNAGQKSRDTLPLKPDSGSL